MGWQNVDHNYSTPSPMNISTAITPGFLTCFNAILENDYWRIIGDILRHPTSIIWVIRNH
jgi:hypothetical protein